MMRYEMCRSGRIVFLILSLMVCSRLNVNAESYSAKTQESPLQAMPAASHVPVVDMPTLVVVEGSGSSFLSRVVNSVLLPAEQNSGQNSDTKRSPVEPTTQKESSSEPPHSASALRSLIIIGSLGISWGLIVLLALRLVFLKKSSPRGPIETDIISPTSYQILGDIAAEHHKFQLAEQCYRKIAEKESYNKEIHHEIGKALFYAERYNEAIKEFHIALGSEIISPEIYGFLARAYQAVKQPERAVQYSQKALQYHAPIPALRKKEARNVIPLQRRLKIPKTPRHPINFSPDKNSKENIGTLKR